MSSMKFVWLFIAVTSYLITLISNSEGSDLNIPNKDSFTIENPSIPVHFNNSRDNEGEDHDSEPFRNNGRGSHEAHSQNLAAENNGTHGQPIDVFQKMMLDENNKYRQQMCADVLEADENLHDIAMQLAHTKAIQTSNTTPTYNQIIYALNTSDPSTITPEQIVASWFANRKNYKPDNEQSATDFSQLVWKESKKFGVGHVYDGQTLLIIALYQPGGNISGKFSQNVGCTSDHS